MDWGCLPLVFGIAAVMFFLTPIGISCYFCGAEGILDGIAILNLILFFCGRLCAVEEVEERAYPFNSHP